MKSPFLKVDSVQKPFFASLIANSKMTKLTKLVEKEEEETVEPDAPPVGLGASFDWHKIRIS